MNKEYFANRFVDEITCDPNDNYFTEVLEHSLDFCLPKVVCDVGCGNGVFTGAIKKKFDCKLIGIDANSHALKQASNLDFDKLIKANDFSSKPLALESNSVDLVICKDVMEHLLDPVYLMREIFRITKPGGFVLLHVPNHFPIWGRLKFLLTNDIDTFSYFTGSSRYDFPHIRFYTLSSIEEMLIKSGFMPQENLSYFFSKPPIIHRLIPQSLTKVLSKTSTDNFSEGITVLASKAL